MADAHERDAGEMLERVRNLVMEREWEAWFIANVIEFMAEALPDDAAGALSTKCTLIRLREETAKLAQGLGSLFHDARHG